MPRVCIVALLLLTAAGCVLRPRTSYEADSQVMTLPAVVVFQGSTGALSYQAATGSDGQRLVPGARAQGRACQRGIQLPIFAPLYASGATRVPGGWVSSGWGEGGYRRAMDDLRQHLPAEAVLYDVRADVDIRMIMSVYREECLVLDAGVLVPVATTP